MFPKIPNSGIWIRTPPRRCHMSPSPSTCSGAVVGFEDRSSPPTTARDFGLLPRRNPGRLRKEWTPNPPATPYPLAAVRHWKTKKKACSPMATQIYLGFVAAARKPRPEKMTATYLLSETTTGCLSCFSFLDAGRRRGPTNQCWPKFTEPLISWLCHWSNLDQSWSTSKIVFHACG